MTLKAYSVDDGDERAEVIFATSSAAARREFGWEEVGTCRRDAVFDRYAPGPVPLLALIEAGWWIECYGCGRKIESQIYDYDDAFDDEGNDLPEDEYRFAPVEVGRRLFCCPACLSREQARERQRAASDAAMVELVETRFPGAEVTSVSTWPGEQEHWHATFRFPGSGRDGADYDLKDPLHCRVVERIRDAFVERYGIKDPA